MNQFLRKGSKVLVDGRLKLDQWTDQQGNKRSKHSVIIETLQMLGSKADNEPRDVPVPPQPTNSPGYEVAIEEQESPF